MILSHPYLLVAKVLHEKSVLQDIRQLTKKACINIIVRIVPVKTESQGPLN